MSREQPSVTSLIAALRHSSPATRVDAIRQLRAAGETSITGELRRMAASDSTASVGVWALLTARQLEHDTTTPAPTASLRDAGLTAPESEQGARYWVARLAHELARPELAPHALAAVEALGHNGADGIVRTCLADFAALERFEALGIPRLCDLIVRFAAAHPAEAIHCFMLLSSGKHASYHAALAAIARDPETPFDRARVLHVLASGGHLELVEELVADPDPATSDTARTLLRAAGRVLPLPAPAKRFAASSFPHSGAVPRLAHAIPERGIALLVAEIARVLDGSRALLGPEIRSEEVRDRPYLVRTTTTTRWHWDGGGFAATSIAEAEFHDHEGGGVGYRLEIECPGDAVIRVALGLQTYSISGPDEPARRARFAFHRALAALGWEPLPGLPWRDGWIELDALRPCVRFEARDHTWRTELPANRGMLVYLAACAELLGDMLLVWTYCEHANAGGSPFLFRLHRVLETGQLAWTIDVDLLPNEHAISLDGETLVIEAGWTTSLDDEGVPLSVRRFDATTGAPVAAPS